MSDKATAALTEQGKKKHKKKHKKKKKLAPTATEPDQPPLAKKARVEQHREDEAPIVPVFAESEADDHCETPLEAYEDVAVFLDTLCAQLGRTRATLRVYDPYYCAGGVVERLGRLGFAQVANAPRDCYRWQRSLVC